MTPHHYTWQGLKIEANIPEHVFKKLAFAALRDHECYEVFHDWYVEECRRQDLEANQLPK